MLTDYEEIKSNFEDRDTWRTRTRQPSTRKMIRDK